MPPVLMRMFCRCCTDSNHPAYSITRDVCTHVAGTAWLNHPLQIITIICIELQPFFGRLTDLCRKSLIT